MVLRLEMALISTMTIIIMEYGFGLGPTRKRIPVRKNLKKYILEKVQKGKCWKCHESFKSKGVRPIIHHLNINARDSKRPENLVVVCPDCHDKIHQKEKKVRKKVMGLFGPEYKVVKKTVRRKTKRRITKKKRRKQSDNLFSLRMPRMRF